MKLFKRTSAGDRVFDIVNIVLMTILLLVTLYPFIYVVMYSFSDPTQAYGKLLLWPQGFTLASYVQCLPARMSSVDFLFPLPGPFLDHSQRLW